MAEKLVELMAAWTGNSKVKLSVEMTDSSTDFLKDFLMVSAKVDVKVN